jgi:hypothetical protein
MVRRSGVFPGPLDGADVELTVLESRAAVV